MNIREAGKYFLDSFSENVLRNTRECAESCDFKIALKSALSPYFCFLELQKYIFWSIVFLIRPLKMRSANRFAENSAPFPKEIKKTCSFPLSIQYTFLRAKFWEVCSWLICLRISARPVRCRATISWWWRATLVSRSSRPTSSAETPRKSMSCQFPFVLFDLCEEKTSGTTRSSSPLRASTATCCIWRTCSMWVFKISFVRKFSFLLKTWFKIVRSLSRDGKS